MITFEFSSAVTLRVQKSAIHFYFYFLTSLIMQWRKKYKLPTKMLLSAIMMHMRTLELIVCTVLKKVI